MRKELENKAEEISLNLEQRQRLKIGERDMKIEGQIQKVQNLVGIT